MTIKVKGYCVPSLTEEVITKLLLISTRLMSLAHSEAGMGQSVPSVRWASGRKSVTTNVSLLYFQILSQFCEDVGKCLLRSKEKGKGLLEEMRKQEKRR